MDVPVRLLCRWSYWCRLDEMQDVKRSFPARLKNLGTKTTHSFGSAIFSLNDTFSAVGKFAGTFTVISRFASHCSARCSRICSSTASKSTGCLVSDSSDHTCPNDDEYTRPFPY